MQESKSFLDWDRQGFPRNLIYDDIYFSRQDPVAESLFVFFEHNGLPERWRALRGGECFVIGETGFGTGLNFLLAADLWQEHAPQDASLHFVSFEKHPLASSELIRVLSRFPSYQNFSHQLIAQYPSMTSGVHRLQIAKKIHLTLVFDDARLGIESLRFCADAWFLDGFAPAKNPHMWQWELMLALAKKSRPGTTLATFTAAGQVSRNLQKTGFRVTKVAGFGAKKNMLTAVCVDALGYGRGPLWFLPQAAQKSPDVVVIGAGIAGTTTAYALAQRGVKVQLLERQDVASEASGNPQAVLYPRLSAYPTLLSTLVACGYLYSVDFVKKHLVAVDPESGLSNWSACGLIQLGFDLKECDRQQKLREGPFSSLFQFCTPEILSRLAGVQLDQGGLWFPEALWLNPTALCRRLSAHPNIELVLDAEVRQLHFEKSHWLLHGNKNQRWQASSCVICCGEASARFAQTRHLPLKVIRGQLSYLAQGQENALRCILCHKGYICPPQKGRYTVGATFNFNDQSRALREQDHLTNMRNLRQYSPHLAAKMHNHGADICGGRVNFRTTTPDYLPVVGPLVQYADFCQRYRALSKNARAKFSQAPTYEQGLFINTGHGSRGFITAPLSAELIVSWIRAEPAPLSEVLIKALHPSRFLLRDLIRSRI